MKPIRITQDTKYPEMYRLEWEDGVLSEDFYNKSRANNILLNYDDYLDRMDRSVEMQGNTRRKQARELMQEGRT